MSKKIALVGSKLTTLDKRTAKGLIGRAVRLGHRSLAVTLSVLLFLQPAIANAQSVSAAGSAPVTNQPGVGAAPNGVPLVDIVTPNGAGLSHNKYDNFNVGTKGLILNNFNGEQGTSNLGGVTPGNPNLKNSGPASVILNEVTSGNRSALNGPTEIYGGSADVIIANPNGITCNGCGFINTPRATLTTGVPNIGADGSLTGFTVNGGDVTFEGAGGNFAAAPGSVDLFDVVARNIHVNAPLYGKTVRLTGGASKYDYKTGDSTALTATSGTPEYAIDGTALGAMQADRIKVVVTEKGAGVKMSGDMAANAGELSLSADGKISIGNASGSQGVNITSKRQVTAAKITSKQKLAVQANQGVTLQTVAADGDIILANGAGLLSVSGDVNGGTTLQLSSDGGIAVGNVTAGQGAATLVATSGDIAVAGAANSAGDLSMTATSGSISAASLQGSQTIALNAALDIAVVGNMQAQGNVNATGRSIAAEKVVSGINIAATSADPNGNMVLGAAGGDLGLTATGGNIATGNLVSAGSLKTSATGNVTAGDIQSTTGLTITSASLAASSITSHGALTVNAARGRVGVSGQVLAAGNVLISGSALQAGAVAAGVDFAATNANGSSIVLGSSGTLGLTATAGNIVADKLLSAGDLSTQAALLQVNNVTSHGNAGISGGVSVANQLLGAGDITINGNANGVSAGLLASGVDFAATKAANGDIVLANSGDLTINDSAGAIQAGTVLAAGTINATGQSVTADTITGQKDITLSGATSAKAGSGVVNVTGQVLGAGNVSVSGSSIAADAIVSGVDIAATNAAGGRITLGPTTTGTGNLTLTAAGAISTGTLLSAGDLSASSATITAGNISAHHDMTLGGVISVNGQILGAGNVSITGPSLSAQSLVAGLDFSATDAANGRITLGQSATIAGNRAGDLTVSVNGAVTAPTIQAAGVIDISGASVTADSITGHENVTLAGATTVNNQILGGSDVSVSGQSIKAGSVVSGVDFARTAAANGNIVLSSSGDLTLSTANALNVGSLLSAGGLRASGSSLTANSVTAHGDIVLGGAINVMQQILAAGNVLISGQSLSAQTVVAGIDFSATNIAGGSITLGQTGDLKVAVDGAVTAPTIQAAGVIDVRGASITTDVVKGHRDITLSGATAISNQVLGGGNVSISGSSINAGSLVAGVDFAATAASGSGIVLTSAGDLTLASTGNINAGALLSAGNLNASGTTITADKIAAHREMLLGGAISVTGQILGAGNVLISGQSLSVQTIAAGLDFGATDAANGKITLGQIATTAGNPAGDLTVSVKGAVTAPIMQAAGNLNVSGASIAADTITSHKNATISGTAAGVNITNQVLGGGGIGIAGSNIKAGAIISGVDFAATAAANGHIVQTTSGDMSLASPGGVSIGTLLSAGNLSASGATVTADGITAHGRAMRLAGAISVTGQILSAGNVFISGQSLSAQTVVAGLDFGATDTAGGNIVLGQAGDLTVSVNGAVTAPILQAAGVLDISGTSVAADAITGHKDITVTGASGPIAVTNQVLGGGNINLSGSAIDAGAIISGVDFAKTAAANGNIVVSSSGDLTLSAANALNVGSLLSAGSLGADTSSLTANSVTAHGDMTLVGAINVAQQILGSGNVLISGQSLSVQTLVAGIDFGATNGAGGNIALGHAGDLKVAVNGAVLAPTIQAAGLVDVSGTSIAADAITGHKDVTLSGATTVKNQVLGGDNVGISGPTITVGAIISGVDFAATAAANGHIVQTASGDLTLGSSGAIDAGTLLSASDLIANGATITAGNISAHHDMTLGGVIDTTTASGRIDVSGQILGAGNVSITGSSLSVQSLVAGLDFNATDAANGKITLGPGGDLKVATSGIVTVPTVQAAGAIDIRAAAVTGNAMTGHKDITVSAASGPVDVTGQVLGGGNVNLSGSAIKADAIISGIDFTRTAAANGHIVQTTSGDISLTSPGSISVGTLQSAGNLTASGLSVSADSITARHDMTLGGAINVSSQILGSGNVLISGQSLSAQTVVAGIDFGATDAAGGNIVLGQSGDLKVTTSGAVAVPTIQAAGVIDISGTSIAADGITGHKEITLSGATAVTNQVLGGGNVGISGSSIKVGTVVSGVDFASTAASGGGIVLASGGDLMLTSTGNLNAGTLLSAGSLGAAGTAINANAVTAHGDMTLAGAIKVDSQILSSGNVLISGQSLSAQTVVAGIDFSETNAAGGNIVLGQTGDLKVATSGVVTVPTVQAAGTIDIRAAAVTSNAMTGHKDISVSAASGPVDVTNQVLGGGNVKLSGSAIKADAIISGIDFTRTAAANGHIVQTTSGDITLTAPGAISAGTLLSAGNLNASGSTITADGITAHGAVTLGGAIRVTDQILGSGNVSITGQNLSAQTVVAGIDFDATNRAGGSIVLGRTGELTVSTSGAVAALTMQAAGVIDVSGATINANAITGRRDITVSGSTTVTSQVLGGGNIAISGPGIKVGTMVSGVDFARTAAANGNIVLASSGDLTLAATGLVNAGTLLSAGTLNASGSTVAADGITAHGAVTLGGAISVTNQILGSGNVSITGQSLAAQTVVAGIDFAATNAAAGNIILGQRGDLTVNVNGTVAAPTIQAAGAIDVGGASVAAASITGHKDISVSGTAGAGVNVANQVLGGGNVDISGSSIKAGAIVSGVDFAATAAANGTIVQTTSGNLTLASTGSINTGTLLSGGALSASGLIVNADAVTAHGDVTLNGATSIAGQILGSGNVSITGQSLSAQTVVAGIDFAATNASGGNIVVGQTGDLTAQLSGGFSASTMQAAAAINVNAATVTADTATGHKDITLSGATTVNRQILGGGNIGISGSSIKAGTIVSGVDFAATAAANGNIVQTTSGSLTLASAGSINTGALLSAGGFSASGATVNVDAVTAHGAVTLNGATTVAGQILGAGNILITGQSLSAQTVVAGIDFAATNASGGNIALGETGDVTAQLSGGLSASTLQAAGTIDVNAATVTADTVSGHKDIALAGATTVSGQILGGGTISVSGSNIAAGAIVSGVDFAGTAAANGNIVQASSGDVSLTSSGDITAGALMSAGDLTAQAMDLTAGNITSHGNTNLTANGTAANGRVNVSGQVLSAGNLRIEGASLSSGLLASGVDFASTNGSGGNIALASSGAMNLTFVGNATAATILSAGDLNANAGNLKASSITSHGKVGIVGNVDVNNQILAAGDLTISGSSISAPTLISGIDFAATNGAGGNIVLASSGAMNLTASGGITASTILSAGDITANAADLIAGSITAHGNAAIAGNVDVSNQIIAARNLTVSGGSINAPVLISGVDFTATNAGGGIVLGTAGDMTLTASAGILGQTMLSAGAIDASGATITANTVTGHRDISLTGSNSVNVTGQLLAAGDVLLSGSTVQLGQAVTGVDFAATARSANGAIALGPNGDLTINAESASATMLIVAGGLNVAAGAFTGGNITSHGAVAIGSSTSPDTVKINGQLLGAGKVSLIGSAVSGNVIAVGVDFAAMDQSGAGNVILGQTGDLTLTATTGDVSFNSLLAAGTITANAANNVSANAVAHGDLALTAGNAITLLGQSLGTGNINLNARSISIDTLVSGVDFAATNASANGSLMLRHAGTMTLAASNGSISANSLLSGGNLAATATQNISYNSLQSLGNALLTSPGAISYTSTTRVGGSLTLNTGALDLSGSKGSRMAGGGTLIVNASSANLSGSNLVFGGLSLNLSGNADLSNAQVSTVTNAGGSGDITVSAAGLTTNANTALLAAHDLTLNLPSLGNAGQLAAGNNLNVNLAGDFSNAPGGLVFAGNNSNLFVGGTLTNNQGALLASNGLTIAGPGGGQRNGAVVNIAGLIQSGGTMSILTNGLSNVTTSAPAIQRNVQISNAILSAYDVITRTYRCATRCNGSGDHDPPTYTWIQAINHLVSQIVSQDQLISGAGASAQIRAGRDLTINATNLWNSYSSIKSDGNMLLTVAGTLTNDGATLNRVTQTICDSSTPCQYYPNVVSSDPTQGGLDCSGPNRPCIGGNDPSLTYTPNPNGTRDPSRDLNPGTTVSVQAIGVISGVVQARGGLNISAGAVNNVASNGSIAGQVAIDAPATANNPLGALNSMTAGGALFNVNAALSNVAANGGASASSGPSLAGSGPTVGSGPAISSNNLQARGSTSISGASLTANTGTTLSGNRLTAATGASVNGGNTIVAGNASVAGTSLTAAGSTSIGNTGIMTTSSAAISGSGVTAATGAAITGNGMTAAAGPAVNGGGLAAAAGASVSSSGVTASNDASVNGSGVTAAAGPAIGSNILTAASASVSPNSLMGKLTTAIGNSGNLTQILQTNGAQLATLAKPQSGGVGGTVPGQVFLFETRAAFLDVSKFYGSAYFIDRIGYTPETKVPFLGDAYFDNQLIDEQMRQLVGNGLGAGSFVPGDNATDQMKALLDNGVAYAEAHGLGLGQPLTPEQAASLTQSMVIYQTEVVDGAPVLVPVVYLSAEDRAKTTSAAMIAGNTVSIDASSVDNSGAIAAADGMTINAGSIKANGGAFLAGGNLNLNAENGITLAAQTMNIGGQTVVTANGGVTAGGNLKMDAGAGSLTLSGTKVAAGGSAQLSGQTVTLGAVKQDNGGVQTLVGTTVTTGGNLSIAGTNGVNVIASSAKVGGDLSIASSNGSISIISAGVENTVLTKDRLDLSQGGTITTTTSQIQQGSSLIAGGSMMVSGNQGVLIGGSLLDAGGNLGIVSTNGNIAITASQDQTTSQSKTIAGVATGYKSGQSSSAAVTSNGSSITSQNGNVTVQADAGNISVIGSDIDAKGGAANVIAKGDVTIGEATDSASSSSKFGSKKATEATTTAEGSSITGQTGVNIASTGGNVTVSASDVTAGDAAHTANANISAAGNIVIASGKNTDETTSDSKKSGFLSSSKTHTHTYDEDTVGSSITASGNITVNAGGEAVVSGSNMAAGNDLSLSGSTVTVMGAEEEHESDKQVKKSGIGVGSGGGFISIYGSKDSKNSQSATDNIGSTLSSGGTTTITSTQGDVNIFGSSSHSGDGTVISSARDVNIAPGAEEQSSSSETKRSGFGINFSSGDGSLSIGIGVAKSEEQRSKDANINAVSTLDSDGSITIAANRNINDQSGKILAAGPISLIAGDNVNMLSSNDVTNASEMQKKSFAGVSITVQSSLIAAGQQAMQAGSLLSGDNGIYGIAPAVLAGVNGYNAITSTMAAINARPDPKTGIKPAVAGISLTAGYSFSESSQQSTTSIPVPPEIRGSSVTIIAQSGDVLGRGVQISAGIGKDGKAPTPSSDPNNGNVLISAAGKVDLESVQATSDSKSSSKSGSVSVGVGASIDASGNIFNAGPTANAAYGSGKQVASSVTQVNSTVSGTNTVTVVAGDTLTLAGGVLSGNTVNVGAVNGITIESRQDTASYDEKSKSVALGISSGGISGGYNQGTITGDYANVSQQSGIFAGSGGYHVNTDGTIDLKGGFIGSTADPKNNDLTANQILYSNIENSMSASSTSFGVSLIGPGIPVPIVGQPAKQSDSGATLATITPGNWNLTGQSQDLSGLNTDASKANIQVDNFDIDKLKAQQQSAAAMSQLLNMGIGYLASQMQWEEGSAQKVALHAAAAALVAQLAGGNPGQAAAASAVEELVNGFLTNALKSDPNLTAAERIAIQQWAAAFVGAAIGGNGGAAAAIDTFKYNFLKHEQLDEAKDVARAIDKCEAAPGTTGCSNQEIAQLYLQKTYYLTLSQENTKNLIADCAGSTASAACQEGIRELRQFLRSVETDDLSGLPTEQRAGAFAVTQSVFVYDRILGDHLQGVLDGTLTPDQALTGALTEISKLQGGVAAFLDAAGVVGGVAACGSTAGVACALGLLGAAGAANHLYGDARQAVTGEAAKSILELALEKQGYSAADAAKYQAYIDAGILVVTVGTVGGQTVYGFAVNASKLGGANSASRVLQGIVADAEIGAKKIDDVALELKGVSCSGTKCMAGCSFDGSTLVKTVDGFTAIRDIRPGKTQVWSRDEHGNEGYKLVLHQFLNRHSETVYVTLRSESTGHRQTITTTLTHPFFAIVPEGAVQPAALPEGRLYQGPIANGSWVAARDLKQGYRLLGADGSWTDVVGVRVSDKPLDAYNLTVAGFHTYFVKQADNADVEPVWVHNSCTYTPTVSGDIVSSNGAKYATVGQTNNGNPVYYSNGNYFEFNGTGVARIDARQQGIIFETQLLDALGIDKNTLKVIGTLDDGTTAYTIPDGLGNLGKIGDGVLESKFYNATTVTKTSQLEAQMNYAISEELPYNLVVGPNTVVDKALEQIIDRLPHGGNIYRFNPTTGTVTRY